MRLKKTFYIFLISVILLNLTLVYATNATKANNNYFRIHIVANSDSIDDQLLKYTVSKQVNEYIKQITKDCKNKEDSKKIVEQNIQSILKLCNTIIKENNFDYTVKAHIGKISYGEKNMDDIHMNAGIYDSLKIIIGNGTGSNWWSLIYPTSFNNAEQQNSENNEPNFSLGIVELIQKFFTKIR